MDKATLFRSLWPIDHGLSESKRELSWNQDKLEQNRVKLGGKVEVERDEGSK